MNYLRIGGIKIKTTVKHINLIVSNSTKTVLNIFKYQTNSAKSNNIKTITGEKYTFII